MSHTAVTRQPHVSYTVITHQSHVSHTSVTRHPPVAPTVLVPNQLMSAPADTSVTLTCTTEASPKAVTYWAYGGNMVMSSDKYNMTERTEHYRTTVLLTVS